MAIAVAYIRLRFFQHFEMLPINRLRFLTLAELGTWFPRGSFSEIELSLSEGITAAVLPHGNNRSQ